MRLQILVPSARRYGSTAAASPRTVGRSTPSSWAHRSSGAAIGRPRSGSCQVPTRPVYRTHVRGRHRERCLPVRGSRTHGERWPQPVGPTGGGRRACHRGWWCRLPPGGCGTRSPRSASPVTVSTRCRSDRPNRSSFQTTRVSPGAELVQELGRGWGDRLRAPLAVSVNPGSSWHAPRRRPGGVVGGRDDVDFGHEFWIPLIIDVVSLPSSVRALWSDDQGTSDASSVVWWTGVRSTQRFGRSFVRV